MTLPRWFMDVDSTQGTSSVRRYGVAGAPSEHRGCDIRVGRRCVCSCGILCSILQFQDVFHSRRRRDTSHVILPLDFVILDIFHLAALLVMFARIFLSSHLFLIRLHRQSIEDRVVFDKTSNTVTFTPSPKLKLPDDLPHYYIQGRAFRWVLLHPLSSQVRERLKKAETALKNNINKGDSNEDQKIKHGGDDNNAIDVSKMVDTMPKSGPDGVRSFLCLSAMLLRIHAHCCVLTIPSNSVLVRRSAGHAKQDQRDAKIESLVWLPEEEASRSHEEQ